MLSRFAEILGNLTGPTLLTDIALDTGNLQQSTTRSNIGESSGLMVMNAQAVGKGQCKTGIFSNTYCEAQWGDPYFFTNTNGQGDWLQRSLGKRYNEQTGQCVDLIGFTENWHRHNCSTGGGECDEEEMQNCINQWTWTWNDQTCTCECLEVNGCFTPVLLDVLGNGFDLTSAAEGVYFDFDGDGTKVKASWTSASSDDAF